MNVDDFTWKHWVVVIVLILLGLTKPLFLLILTLMNKEFVQIIQMVFGKEKSKDGKE